MLLTIFRVAMLYYAEIKNFVWSKIVVGLGTANQSALFQHSFATLKFVYDISSNTNMFFLNF